MNNTDVAEVSPAIKRGEIALLLGTRGRPQQLVEVFNYLGATTAQKDKVALWLYVDDDDQLTRQAISANAFPNPGLAVHWHIGPRLPGWGRMYQVLWDAQGHTSEAYMIANDDVRFETQGWDDIVRAKFAKYPDGILLAYPHDLVTPNSSTYPFFGWGWLNTLGQVYAGYFHYWFDDLWSDQVGRMIGRFIKLPVVLAPIRGKGRTQRMRCLPFWTRFFQLMLPERKAAATKLITAMYPKDEHTRATALAKMEEVADSFRKETEKFSDLYHVFQEERHTAMSMEERDRLTPLYFQQEAQAVFRLLSYAQEHFDKKDYAEALKYIEATQMADIRVRQAHEMKVKCLRALGRQAEANRVARETFLAWPRMNFARRTFRFLGKVANEGRTLLAGLTGGGKFDHNRNAASR